MVHSVGSTESAAFLCDALQRPVYAGSTRLVTVASYRRRHLLVEEVPGLYIRRLTLEDPKSARERPNSRSDSPTRHICHPRSSIAPGRRTSRSWLDRIANERPAFLTITSLELPDCPIPLIESQASARGRAGDSGRNVDGDKDEILDELLEKVAEIRRESQRDRNVLNSRESRRNHLNKRTVGSAECNRTLADLDECTRSIIEGTDCRRSSALENVQKDCICSEISEKLRINIRKKTEVRRSSRSPSPEVTHIIRIAMKYHGQSECRADQKKELPMDPGGTEVETHGSRQDLEDRKEEGGDAEDTSGRSNGTKDSQENWALRKEENCCSGVNVALDFTLNCSSVQLTSRDVSVKAGIKNK